MASKSGSKPEITVPVKRQSAIKPKHPIGNQQSPVKKKLPFPGAHAPFQKKSQGRSQK